MTTNRKTWPHAKVDHNPNAQFVGCGGSYYILLGGDQYLYRSGHVGLYQSDRAKDLYYETHAQAQDALAKFLDSGIVSDAKSAINSIKKQYQRAQEYIGRDFHVNGSTRTHTCTNVLLHLGLPGESISSSVARNIERDGYCIAVQYGASLCTPLEMCIFDDIMVKAADGKTIPIEDSGNAWKFGTSTIPKLLLRQIWAVVNKSQSLNSCKITEVAIGEGIFDAACLKKIIDLDNRTKKKEKVAR